MSSSSTPADAVAAAASNGDTPEKKSMDPPTNPDIDFTKNLSHFSSARYLMEVCHKLDTNVLTTATALHYFHTFYKNATFERYDPFTIGCTCIYLASKVVDDDIRIRDIVNVGVNCINRDSPPLMLEPYFTMRDSLTQAELLLMRILGFNLRVELPHKYLLLYLQALGDWLGRNVTDFIPIKETAWKILQDCYHDPMVIKHSPQLLAVSCLHITLELLGVEVPNSHWYKVIHHDCTKDKVSELSLQILSVYNEEKKLSIHEPKTSK